MCLTNEPGCYIIPGLLKEAKENADHNKYFNWEMLEAYGKEIQACRIEDDFLITKDGHRRFTNLPRTIESIEACLRNEDWEH